jgi:hypothetical protein
MRAVVFRYTEAEVLEASRLLYRMNDGAGRADHRAAGGDGQAALARGGDGD